MLPRYNFRYEFDQETLFFLKQGFLFITHGRLVVVVLFSLIESHPFSRLQPETSELLKFASNSSTFEVRSFIMPLLLQFMRGFTC
jgi:hypothetical protein